MVPAGHYSLSADCDDDEVTQRGLRGRHYYRELRWFTDDDRCIRSFEARLDGDDPLHTACHDVAASKRATCGSSIVLHVMPVRCDKYAGAQTSFTSDGQPTMELKLQRCVQQAICCEKLPCQRLLSCTGGLCWLFLLCDESPRIVHHLATLLALSACCSCRGQKKPHDVTVITSRDSRHSILLRNTEIPGHMQNIQRIAALIPGAVLNRGHLEAQADAASHSQQVVALSRSTAML